MIARQIAVVLAVVSLTAGSAARAGELARGDLAIVGTSLEVDRAPVAAATGVPSYLQTIFGGKTNDEAPVVPGLAALGELTGPGIDRPITLTTVPGKKFAIPVLHVKGEYTLQNIRLVGAQGEFLQPAVPTFATINVTDALSTQLRVRQLTAEELRERGIVVDSRNYEYYEYTFVFAIDGTTVEVPYPVIIDRWNREILPVAGGGQNPAPLPENKPRLRLGPPLPKFFDIGPVGIPEFPESEVDGEPRIPPRIPAALVIPTGFGVLHQFFAVVLQVSNATEEGSGVVLDSVSASLSSPLQMRVSKVVPAVAIGQAVPIVDETTGATFLVAAGRGSAEWTLEALKSGTHTIDVDVRATYQKPGQEDFPMQGRVSASIVVSDPRFQINFSHPDTVRKDERYTAYAFVTNQSEQRQHVVLDLAEAIPPCGSGGALQNICLTSGTGHFELDLEPGQMTPVPYELQSKVTGQVFAAAGSASDEAIGVSVALTMGVSTSGIPLSPATLLMPYYAQFLPSSFVDANLQLLGLGYSLATAPLNKYTAAQPRVITNDVFTRAQEIARAGQRIFVTRQQRDVDVAAEDRNAMANLSLDLLDNVERVDLLDRMPPLEEWDELRRREESGRRSGAAMARELERTFALPPVQFVDEFAAATAHRSPFLMVYAHGPPVAGNDRPYALSISSGSALLDVVAEAAAGWKRDLPHGELTRFDLGGRTGELALVGRWRDALRVRVLPAASSFTIHILFPGDTNGSLLRADLEITNATPGEEIAFDLIRGAPSITLLGVTTSVTGVAAPPLRVLGAAQDLHLDSSGHVVTALFNRPVTIADGEHWRDRIALTIDVPKAGYTVTRRNDLGDPNAELQVPSARLQDDSRLLNITFDKVLSRNAEYEIDLENVLDRLTAASFTATDVVPRVDNDRPGAILTGRVLLADNSPVPAFVTLTSGTTRRENRFDPIEPIGQADVAGADGRFMFEYVPRDLARGQSGQYSLRARLADGRTAQLDGAVRLPGEVHSVNLVFVGRGLARGHVRYDDGTPIPDRQVSVTSPLHPEVFTDFTDASGYYETEVGVGPLTFSFIDAEGRVTFAANQLQSVGQIITQDLIVDRSASAGKGTVHVTVRDLATNEPLPNAIVVVAYGLATIGSGWSDANGRFSARDVPAGVVSILAEYDYATAGIEVDLRPDQVLEQEVFLDLRPAIEYGRVEGVVTRDDPSAPGDTTKDQPVAGAMIAIRGLPLITTAADGTFAIPDVPVQLSGFSVTVYDPSTARRGYFSVPTITANATSYLPMRLSSTAFGKGTMRVRLFGAHGEPVSGYELLTPGFPPTLFQEKGSGVYELGDLRVPQEDAIVAIPRGVAAATYGEQFATGRGHIEFDGQVGVSDLRLPGQGTIVARIEVEQPCGTPPCYAPALGTIALSYTVWSRASQGRETKTIETEPDPVTGKVTFTNVPARQEVTLSTVSHPLGHASGRAFLTHDGDAREVALRLQDVGDVSGRVFAHDGVTPVSGAAVRIVVGTAVHSQQLSKPDGAFNFPGISASSPFQVIAELTQNGVYRTGLAEGRTPPGGGPVSDLRVVMREQSSIEGHVVDAGDDVVPLANYWLRELSWPHRQIGSEEEPLQADINGRFVISNVFTGPFRITAVSATNQELRGDYQGTLEYEGDASQRSVALRIGAGGTGTISVTVVDPSQAFEPVENAEVALLRNGARFDLASSDANGIAWFEQVPAGTYVVTGYSKARVRGGTSASFTVSADLTSSVTVELDIRGEVSGYVVDPDGVESDGTANPEKRVFNIPVTITGWMTSSSTYTLRDSTDSAGEFAFVGVPEGEFRLSGFEPGTERAADGPVGLFISRVVQEQRDVRLELERFAKLNVRVHLPDDAGGPGELAPMAEVFACQCSAVYNNHYDRAFQGNPVTFERMLHRRGYTLTVKELGGEGRTTVVTGAFPAGVYDHTQIVVLPPSGTVEVLVVDGSNAPVSEAAVRIASNSRVANGFTGPNGMLSIPGFAFGNISVQATKGAVGAAANGTLASRSQPLRITLSLGSTVIVAGIVDAEGFPVTPSAGTRVLLNAASPLLASPLLLETTTNAEGAFTFGGIPVGSTTISLTYYSPDDTTVGARLQNISIPDGTTGTFNVARVTLDGSPPSVLSIEPPANSTNVSPATQVVVTFSEQLPATYLTRNYFQLHASDDGSQVQVTVQSSVRPDGTFVVRLIPPAPAAGQTFPLKSNVLYRFVIADGIRDLTGNALKAVAGTSFTTVNYTEPDIVSVEPAEEEALVEGQTFRIRFNKEIDLASFDPGNGGIVTLERLDSYRGAVAAVVPITRYLDPQSAAVLVVAPDGVAIEESSYYRLTVAGVLDTSVPPNAQRDTRRFEYFSFDRVVPVAQIVSPVGAAESLVAGVLYTATVDVTNPGGSEAGDVAYVDWLDENGSAIARVRSAPWGYSFVAPSVASPSTYTLKASATDLSFNSSEVTSFTWNVVPNEAPRDIVVTSEPLSAYPSAPVETTVAFSDEGVAVTVALEIRGTKSDGTPFVQSLGSRQVTRASTAVAFGEAVFNWTLPLALKDGPATVVATVTDSVSRSATGEAVLTVLADQTAPLIVSLLPQGESRYRYGVNGSYDVEIVAKDLETGVARAVIEIDGTTVLDSTSGVFEPATGTTTFLKSVAVPPRNADTRIAIVATVYDHRGNSVSVTREVIYERVDDATVPEAAWITPLDGAALPSNVAGWTATLRVRATDDTKVTSVRFESGALAAPITLTAPKSGTTDVFEAEASLNMPADGSSFVITAVVADGDPLHDVELPITIDPVAVSPVVSGDIAITSINVDQYANRSVLVRGARVYVAVPLVVNDLILVDGATITTPDESALDLTVNDRLFVDADSAVDVTARGFLGGLRAREDASYTNTSILGMTVGRTTSGGSSDGSASHAGIGGAGYGATNATYGSITEPSEPGSGGGARADGSQPGANGGGVARIHTGIGIARLVVAGGVRADGGATGWGGGSGGSVDLRAATIVTGWATRVTANGSDSRVSSEVDMGGGGGRLALRATDRLDLDAALPQLQARGGRNGTTLEGSQYVDGGAGTLFVVSPARPDGELILSAFDERHPASTHRTAGTPLVLPDGGESIAIGPRVLAVVDETLPASATVDGTAMVVTDADVPELTLVSTTPVAGSSVPRYTPVVARFTASSPSGVREVRAILTAGATDVVTYPRFALDVAETDTSITVPAAAPLGATSLRLRAIDRAGRVVESAPVAFSVVDNSAPEITRFELTPLTEIFAGHDVAVDAAASDDVAVTSLLLTSTLGTVTAQPAVAPTPQTLTRAFAVSIPPATVGDTDVVLTLAARDGFPSRAATTATQTIRVKADTLPPSLTVTEPVPDALLQEGSGQTFVVEATATDAEVAVQRVFATFERVDYDLTPTGSVYRATLPVPNDVEGSEPVSRLLTVNALDFAGNAASADVTLRIAPLVNPDAPILQWVCGSPGAMIPPGYELAFRVSAVPANAANGVQRVEITIGNGAPVVATSVGTNLYEVKHTIPLGTTDGTVFDVRVRAVSVANNDSTLLGSLTAVDGTNISTVSTIAADDLAFENSSIVVRSGGVLTIHGAHRLRNVVVLSGGKLAQRHADLTKADLLTVDRLFVACGGAVDVTGLGHLGPATHPGAGSADDSSSGSHIGRGGPYIHAAGATFGSLRRPLESGGGGQANGFPPVGITEGGGVVRIHGESALTIDGTVRANGNSKLSGNGGGAGAGGSIWLTTPGTIGGGGVIEANGGTANTHGGGGAIAIEYATTFGPLLANATARGTVGAFNGSGGAGSVYLRNSSQTLGELILDNRTPSGFTQFPTRTQLPSFGRQRVKSVSGSDVALDGVRRVDPSFAGHTLRAYSPDGTAGATYVIDAVSNDGGIVLISGWGEVLTQDATAYEGYVVYSPQGIGGRNFVAARWANDRWEYDTDTIFTAFNPRSGDTIIASFTKDASAITGYATFRCDDAICPADIHGLPVYELSGGEILTNASSSIGSNGVRVGFAIDDAAELFLRPDSDGRALTLTRGVDAAITLRSNDGSPLDLAAGDVLHGLYRFDSVRLGTATVVVNDLLESVAPLQSDATSTLANGNATMPLLSESGWSVEAGLFGPVIVGPAGAVSDPDGRVDVVGTNSATATPPSLPVWNRNRNVFLGRRGGLSLQRRLNGVAAPFGISASNAIEGSGYLSFTPSTVDQQQVGLAPGDATRETNEPGAYAFRLEANGQYNVIANAIDVKFGLPYTATDVFRIEKTPARVRYFVNGVLVHELFAAIPSLRFDYSTRSSTAEIHSIEYETASDDAGRYRIAAAANGSFRLPVHGAPGQTIRVFARDRHRLPIESATVADIVIPANIGVASVSIAPASVVAGRTATGTVTLLGPAGSSGVRIDLASDQTIATVPGSITIPAGATSGTFTITTAAVTTQTDAAISAAYGGVTRSASLRVLQDTAAPVITLTAPTLNQEYTEGASDGITVRATIVDADSGMKQASATVGGTTVAMTKAGNVYSALLPVPLVDGSENVTMNVIVEAEDISGNVASSPVAIVIRPVPESDVLSIAVVPPAAVIGETVHATVRLIRPAGPGGTTVTLASDAPSVATVPASLYFPAGSSAAQFAVTTSAAGQASLSATLQTSVSSLLTVTSPGSELVALNIDTPAVTGGTSANGTVTLGAPAPAGGAVVSLASFDPVASVPPNVVVAEGATSAVFTITTLPVGATVAATISATWGATATASLTLDACASFGVAAQPASTPATIWFDDAPPAGAIVTGTPLFDTSQSAAGTQALHFPSQVAGRRWSFTAGAVLAVGPNDELVIHALVNPCDPPRQIAVTWSGGATLAANWGENQIAPGTQKQIGGMPAAGEWVALRVPARMLGVSSTVNLTGLAIDVFGGEAWFDLAGKSACAVAQVAAPAPDANESVWFDDAAPAGGTLSSLNDATNVPWSWTTSQAARGDNSHLVPARAGVHQQSMENAAERMTLVPGDLIYVWVLVDPCNPPREIMLQFHDGTSYEHRAFWGEDLIAVGNLQTRANMGPIPRAGEWVRLEVPSGLLELDNRNVQSVRFTLYDGAAWFDAIGKISRVNLARGKSATQSSTFKATTPAALAVDGDTSGQGEAKNAITTTQAQPWWQVDLGASQPIESIQLWDRTDANTSLLTNFWIFVSDQPIAGSTVAAARAQTGVRAYHHMQTVGEATEIDVHASGRYVRVQHSGTTQLQLAEVQVWAPASPSRVNLAGGAAATSQSSTYATFTSEFAVDGRTWGDANVEASIIHTLQNAQAWWEIDLGSVQPVTRVDVYGSAHCCLERVTNFHLFVSDTPFTSKLIPQTLAQAGVSSWYYGTPPRVALSFDVQRRARFVRVQLTANNYLQLAEVHIWSPLGRLGALSKRVVTPGGTE